MATTINWPPRPKSGRIDMVQGTGATRILVMTALSDLTANPFNTDGASLNDVIFRNPEAVRAAIERVARRLRSIIRVESIDIESEGDESIVTVNYIDLESRDSGSVTVNG